MSASQRRTRRVTVYVSPDTFRQLEELSDASGGLPHSSVVSMAIARLYRSDPLLKGTKNKSNGREQEHDAG